MFVALVHSIGNQQKRPRSRDPCATLSGFRVFLEAMGQPSFSIGGTHASFLPLGAGPSKTECSPGDDLDMFHE